jgi:glycosyltransferase involved in cell wall biosynthesis
VDARLNARHAKNQIFMARSLFISYDGLTDPLGQSQILPYLSGLSAKGHEIHVLSCEKPASLAKNGKLIEKICADNGIRWTPLRFHAQPRVLAKYYDLYKLTATAFRLHRRHSFDIIHCRSYISADIGRKLKLKKGVRFLFDMRSFWVDERVEGGLWDTRKPMYRLAYKIWKQKEAKLIGDADHIISLTEAAKKEMLTWPAYAGAPITVIPCSADIDLFTMTDASEKEAARQMFGWAPGTFVLSYLGSLGTWYLLDEMLLLFSRIKQKRPGAKFLILTPDEAQKVYERMQAFGLEESDFAIRFAKRAEVPVLLKASDVSVSFIKPAYSKMASSPTKLGELLAMGIPVICNDIGDVATIIRETKGGVVISNFDEASMNEAVDYAVSAVSPVAMDREKVKAYYSLKNAIANYENVYRALAGNTHAGAMKATAAEKAGEA